MVHGERRKSFVGRGAQGEGKNAHDESKRAPNAAWRPIRTASDLSDFFSAA
jgi:hypothetical protein